MINKILLLLILTSFLEADQATQSYESKISYERLIEVLHKYNNHPKGWSPLNYAIEEKDYESALILVEYTDNINKFDDNKNALMRMFETSNQDHNIKIPLSDLQISLVKKMIDYGVNIHCIPEKYFSLLASVCRLGLKGMATELLDRGVEVNELNGAALNGAIHSENLDLMRLLIEHGANVNLSNSLAVAIGTKNPEIIDILVNAGAYLNPNSHGSHLSVSVMLYDIEAVNLLLLHGANPNNPASLNPSKSILGYALDLYETPINKHETHDNYSSKRHLMLDIIELLISYGAKL